MVVLQFLTEYFEKGHSYKTIVGYVSTIRKYISFQPKEAMVIKRFLRGVYNVRPPKKKFMATWDIGILLRHLKVMPISNGCIQKISIIIHDTGRNKSKHTVPYENHKFIFL